MTESLKQKTKELLENKPKEIQTVVNSLGWEEICAEIARKYNLTSDAEINNLQLEVMLVLTGLEIANNLETNIETELETSKETAKNIKNEITEKIIKPIIDRLTNTVKEKIKTETTDWQQNLNFIISGGDYSVFLQKTNANEKLNHEPDQEKTPVNFSKIEDLKNNFTI
jgi:hypothetical protein